MALACDKGADFAIDKPAGTPCPHLARHRCTIHATRASRGFAGCMSFACAGAGQRTVALHGGQSWQDVPALLAPQMETFRHLRRIHDAIELLTAAAALPLSPAQDAARRALLAALCPPDLGPREAAGLATGPLPGRVRAFLRGLQPQLAENL